MTAATRPQHGFAVIAAMFLLVGLAALGSFMVTISNTSHLNSAQDLQGSRAYWAARGGLEWGLAAVSATAPVAPAAGPPAECPTTSAPARLDGFALVVTCAVSVYGEAGADVRIFRLRSVASSVDAAVGSRGFVERSVSATLER